MSSGKDKLRLGVAVAMLAVLGLTLSCTGFFVNPTLNSIAIGPATVSMAPAATQQMDAIGTYSDGSTADVTSKASWSSSDPTVANFNPDVVGELVAGPLANIPNPPGTATISASVGAITSGSTATVTVCPVVVTLVATASPAAQVTGGTIAFTATATFEGVTGSQDVTDEVTWNIGNTTVLSSISDGSGIAGDTPGSSTVSATLCGATSAAITVTIT
jgi:hypothetical protein